MNTLLVDGHNLAWTSSYLAAKSDPNFADYTPDTAREVVYGMLNVLAPLVHPKKNALGRHNVIVALDAGRNWRQLIDPTYKDGRGGSNIPSTRFGAQIARLPEELAKFGIRTVSVPALEGDDVIALLAERNELKGTTKVLLSKDKDILSFVRDDVFLYQPQSKTLVTPRTFGAYTQDIFRLPSPLSPNTLPFYRALVGDPADKLPGVPYCGPVYALSLLNHLQSKGAVFTGYRQTPDDLMAQVTPHLADLPPTIKHLASDGSLAALRHTFTLVQVSQAPVALKQQIENLDISPLPTPTYAQVKAALTELGFPYFADKGPDWAAGFTGAVPAVAVAPVARPRVLQESLCI